MTTREHKDKLWLAAGQKLEERDYWLDKLSGEPVKSSFPYDYKTADSGKKSYQTVNFKWDEELSAGLISLSAASDIRLHIILAAGLNALIYRYLGIKDIIISVPILKPKIEKEFVNTVLLLRNQIEERMTFKELLFQVKQAIAEAGKNRNYPIEVLLEQLGMPFTAGDFPLSEIAILVENIHDKKHLSPIAPGMIFSFSRTAGRIEGYVEYNASLYAKATVERISGHFRNLLQAVLADMDTGLADIDMLSKAEKKQLLSDFNAGASDFPGDRTIHGLFAEQVKKSPKNIAVVDIETGSKGSITAGSSASLTYQELENEAAILARFLINKGLKTGDIVGIMVERSIEMIVGILGILKAGGAYLPLNPKNPAVRSSYMLRDCSSGLLLTTGSLRKTASGLDDWQGETVFIDDPAAEVETGAEAQAQVEKKKGPGKLKDLSSVCSVCSVAYVIYTSGSTGEPKGVPITHGNFCPLMFWGYAHLGLGPEDRVIQNLSYYFDWSVWEIFIALTGGSPLYMISEDVLLNPEAEVDFILKNKITTLHITPTQFQYLINVGKKLETLKYLAIGAEKLTHDLAVRSFEWVHEDCRVFNMYGPTEATIMAAVLEIQRRKVEDYKDLSSVPIGKSIANTALLVLDKNKRLCPIGVEGELYIGGDGLAQGYINNPELSAEKFVNRSDKSYFTALSSPITLYRTGEGAAHPASEGLAAHQSPITLYRTGDRCRWLPDGTVEFLGRLDFQVKIRGYRIEPGEIESSLLNHPGINEVLVTTGQYENGENYLCSYLVAAGQAVESGGMREYLSARLPDYMVPAYFIFLDKMPLNPNGKIDLKALPQPEMGLSGQEYVAPRNDSEEKLTAIWAEVLGFDNQTAIGIDDNFFELGGHSLKATSLVHHIYKEFAVNTEIEEVFANPTIRELAQKLAGIGEQGYTEIIPTEEKDYYELSYAQRRLWILCQFEEDSTAYNMPSALTICGEFNIPAFEQALQSMVERHDSLRTIFVTIDGVPCQKIPGSADFKFSLEQTDLRRLEGAAGEKEAGNIFMETANKAFDLTKGPMSCFKIVRLEEKKYLLIFNIHHIINDGWSQGNMNNEIITLYNAYVDKKENPLPPLKLQYKDYTRWHNDLIAAGSFYESRQYWLEKLKDKPNGTELPFDFSRSPIQTFNGGRVSFILDEEKTSRLHKVSLEEEATLFMSLLTLLNICLYKYTGQRDIVMGAPIAARKRPELYPLVGFLVNTLVYRNELTPGQSFKELLTAIKKETLTCYKYQDYPFDLLVEELGLDRDLSQSPLFNVMLAHNNADTEDIDLTLQGVTVSGYAHIEDFNMSKFDLIFFMDERAGRVNIRIEYNSDLFERSSIERMANNFQALLDNVIENLSVPISTLKCIEKKEYEKVIKKFNDNDYEFPRLTLQQLFEKQAQSIPDKIAVIGTETGRQRTGTGNETAVSGKDLPAISYGDLNKEANRMASYLREKYRVKSNHVIGISMNRSIDMIIVLLAVVKAGAAYLAVDPTYPKDRVLHVLDNSRADLLIIDEMRAELFANYPGEILDINEHRDRISLEKTGNPPPLNSPADILYVNYTSGSTGMPNGAMLSHDILTNLIQWQNEKTTIDCSLRCLQFTSINFCVSFQEIMGTLTGAGELHLIGDVERQDIDYLMDFLSEHRIEVLFLPFSYLNFLFNESSRWNRSFKHSLKHIITAGEQLKITLGLKRFLDLNPHLQLHNHYGSTEMHVVTSYTLNAAGAGRTPIPPAGKPVNNVDIYILDENFNPVPIKVWGEIFVKGSSEVLGYINDPVLTGQKLIKHPQLSKDGLKLYRSGDIGRWHEDGNIELRGRKDSQVKIRGFRVEPGEVESKILSIENIRECVVLVKEDKGGQKFLTAYVVGDIELAGIKKKLSDDLPRYMIPHIILMESLPLMPNGKVDRDKLPEPEADEVGKYTAPRDEVEVTLTGIWSELLDIDEGQISMDANFFELGGHSLKATLMVSRIHKKLDKKILLSEVFKTPTIMELAQHLRSLGRHEYAAIEPVSAKEYYVLSSAQERVFIFQRMNPAGTAYNMPAAVLLEGVLDKDRIEETFRRMIDRHESLRTYFEIQEGAPVQKIHDTAAIEFEIEHYTPDGTAPGAIIEKFVRPFDLSRAPLLRVGLIEPASEKYILMFDMHHIISDGTSLGIFTRDLMELYAGEELPSLKLQYKDYAEWQKSDKEMESRKRQEQYWLEQYSEGIPLLDLPIDFVRPANQDFAGAALVFELGAKETAALNEIARDREVTLYMVLLAVYCVLLAKISGQEDIVIGTPTAGRRHSDLDSLIGMFINTLALRNRAAGEITFFEFLQDTKARTLAAFENQDYPFEDLAAKVQADRDPARNSLFDVMFILQNMDTVAVEIPGLRLSPYRFENRTAKFDLTLQGIELEGKLRFGFVYKTGLFKEETIRRISEYFKEIVAFLMKNRDIQLKDITLSHKLSTVKAEKREIEFGF